MTNKEGTTEEQIVDLEDLGALSAATESGEEVIPKTADLVDIEDEAAMTAATETMHATELSITESEEAIRTMFQNFTKE